MSGNSLGVVLSPGGLAGATLAIAGIFKKGWRWWIVGLAVLAAVVALFFCLYKLMEVESRLETEE